MEKEKLRELIGIARTKRHLSFGSRVDLDALSKYIPNAEIANEIIENNLFSCLADLPFSQPFIRAFIKEFISDRKLDNILDPWANLGEFLNIIDVPKERKAGYVWHGGVGRVNEILKPSFNQKIGFPLDLLNEEKNRFDLILSNLPVGLKFSHLKLKYGTKDGSLQIIAKSLDKLSEKGCLLTTVSPHIFDSKKNRNFYSYLHENGFAITNILEAPKRSLLNLANLEVCLVVIEKKKQENVFICKIPSEIQKHKKILSNIKAKKTDKDISNGIHTPFDAINSISKLKQIKEVDNLIKIIGYPVKKLIEISTPKRSEELEKEFVIVSINPNKEVERGLDKKSINDRNKHLLELDLKKVNPHYIVSFLNSELGKKILLRNAFGTTQPFISKSVLNEIEIPLPDLKTQNEIININRTIRNKEEELKGLRKKLWEIPRSKENIKKKLVAIFRDKDSLEWLEELPFPLASILWGYYSESKIDRKVHYLFLFFEGLCEFLVILILSGLKTNEVYFNDTVRIWLKQPEKEGAEIIRDWHLRASFGNWQYLYASLGKKLRGAYNDEKDFISNIFGGANKDFFKMLTSATFTNSFQNIVKLRNSFKGHGGVSSETKYNEVLNLLESEYHKIKNVIIDGFRGSKLVTVIPKTMDFDDDSKLFETTCKLLQGTRSKFNQIQVLTSSTLNKEKLHLIHENQFIGMEILPFIQMRPSPKTEHNACYFYNRIDDKGVRLVSYHYEQESEVYDKVETISPYLEFLNPNEETKISNEA